MASGVTGNLPARSDAIRERWQDLLLIKSAASPRPDADMPTWLISRSIEQIRAQHDMLVLGRERVADITALSRRCLCGENPYTAYFNAGEQAFLEELVALQSMRPFAGQDPIDFAPMKEAIRRVAAIEIEGFCDACCTRCSMLGLQSETAKSLSASA
jgi:hypothetical protein